MVMQDKMNQLSVGSELRSSQGAHARGTSNARYRCTEASESLLIVSRAMYKYAIMSLTAQITLFNGICEVLPRDGHDGNSATAGNRVTIQITVESM